MTRASVDSSRAALRLGTRGSALALAQAEIVGRALAEHGVEYEMVIIETAGDRRAPDTAWGEGAFVTAIERALAEGRVDAAVHSAKDVPTDEDPKLRIDAYLARAEPRDALVLRDGAAGSIDDLPAGSVIGTDSPRRTGFLRAHRSDLDVRPLHGNVDTRLRRLDEGAVDALLLAAAGLVRLGRADRISQLVPIKIMPPAPGQGAIAVQVRAADTATAQLVARIDDQPTRLAVEAERTFLHASGGGCRSPIGVLATVEGDSLRLVGGFASLDGRVAALGELRGSKDQAAAMAEALAMRLTERRARLPGAARVLITRPGEDSRRLAARLAEHGLSGVIVPSIEIELLDGDPDLAIAMARLADFDWSIVTSANGARSVRLAAARLGIDLNATRWAAVGRATARELLAGGVGDVWLPSDPNAAALAAELPVDRGQSILWARGDLAEPTVAEQLRMRGTSVRALTAYRTIVAPVSSRPLLAQALADHALAAVILASPSAARGVLELAAPDARYLVLRVPAVCVGPRTAAAARELGFEVIGQAENQEAATLAELTAELISAKQRSKSNNQPAGVMT